MYPFACWTSTTSTQVCTHGIELALFKSREITAALLCRRCRRGDGLFGFCVPPGYGQNLKYFVRCCWHSTCTFAFVRLSRWLGTVCVELPASEGAFGSLTFGSVVSCSCSSVIDIVAVRRGRRQTPYHLRCCSAVDMPSGSFFDVRLQR